MKNHSQFTESDYEYLSAKGYTDAEIIELWDRDNARNVAPVVHMPIPDVVGIFK